MIGQPHESRGHSPIDAHARAVNVRLTAALRDLTGPAMSGRRETKRTTRRSTCELCFELGEAWWHFAVFGQCVGTARLVLRGILCWSAARHVSVAKLGNKVLIERYLRSPEESRNRLERIGLLIREFGLGRGLLLIGQRTLADLTTALQTDAAR